MNFGWIRNKETEGRRNLNVTWLDADPKTTAKYLVGAILVGIGIELIYSGAFAAGATAYDNAQDKLFKELHIIN